MGFIENLRGFISQRKGVVDQLKSEDQVKLSLVFPLLRHLGYDTTNPTEIVPEFTADHATKKGEKVDIAIIVDDVPAILVECKAPGQDLTAHNGQLYRYFSVTKAKFAILTNGSDYWFYSDIDAPNKMDDRPFMALNIFDASDNDLQELHRFEKTSFNPVQLAESAEQLKRMNLMKGVVASELRDPSDDLVKLLSRSIYDGRLTQSKLEDYREITRKAIREHLRDYLNFNLQKAMDRISDDGNGNETAVVNPKSEDTQENHTAEEVGITEEEEDALRVLKAILARVVEPERISLRDGKTYNTVLLDQKPRQRIAIFRFGKRKKQIEIFDEDETKVALDKPGDLYRYAQAFENAVSRRLI